MSTMGNKTTERSMKLLAPVTSPDEVESIVEAGADEIYCGVLSAEWRKTYSNIASINRVERRMGNLMDHAQVKEVVRRAHASGVPAYVTLNALYSAPQYGLLDREIEAILEAGPDALIVADPGMMTHLLESGVKTEIHVSTGGTAFNSEAVRFYKDLGITRVVLPRALNMTEIGEITGSSPDIDFEVFVMNGGCMHTDGLCTFHHGLKDQGPAQGLARSGLGRLAINTIYRMPDSMQQSLMSRLTARVSDNACTLHYEVDTLKGHPGDHPTTRKALARVAEVYRRTWKSIHVCGACRIFEFHALGIHSIKVVGRSFTAARKETDVRYAASLRDTAAEGGLTQEEFARLAKRRFVEVYGMECRENCYFP